MGDYKDIYETDDLPEAEQDFEEDNKDCVEKLNVNIATAFNRFKGKEVIQNGNSRQLKYTKCGNPFERSKKILSELAVLSKDIETNFDTNNKNEPVTKEQLLMLIEGLTLQVKELDLDKYFGSEAKFEIKDQNKTIFNKLIENIDLLKLETQKKEENDKGHVYVLKNHTEINEHINQMKVANLLKRLDVVEKVLGNDSVKLSNIVSECPNKGLLEAVERLTAKTGLLNNQQLNMVESRLSGVADKLKNMSTVSSNATGLDQESQKKIAELYELVKKWDHAMDAVPSLVDQCVSMQDYHFKSAKLGQCITSMDAKHQQLASKHHMATMALKNIENHMPSNFTTMDTNIGIIDEKLKKLAATM